MGNTPLRLQGNPLFPYAACGRLEFSASAFLAFMWGICYTVSPEEMQMQVVVLGGTLTEAEQAELRDTVPNPID